MQPKDLFTPVRPLKPLFALEHSEADTVLIASCHCLTSDPRYRQFTRKTYTPIPIQSLHLKPTSPDAALAQAARDGSKGGLGVNDLESAAF